MTVGGRKRARVFGGRISFERGGRIGGAGQVPLLLLWAD